MSVKVLSHPDHDAKNQGTPTLESKLLDELKH